MAILIPRYIQVDGKRVATGHLLYIQEIKPDDFPYEDEFWEKQDGRWLGIGEIENQFENQFARNLSANLRRRSLLWAARKIFQSTDESVNRNLIKDVKDGQIMHIMPNGEISQVNTASQHLVDFNTMDSMVESNANQKSFTFEVATGESLPSGTPFRLGVVLSNAVDSHFKAMKEKLGLFLIRSYYSQIIPIFKKETKDHLIGVIGTEEGIGHLKEMFIGYHLWDEFKRQLLAGRLPQIDLIKQQASEWVDKQTHLFTQIPKGWYDDCKFHMELEITGQAVDTKAQMETLSTVMTSVAQNPAILQNPVTLRLLEMIVTKTGGNLKDIIGKIQPPAQPQMGQNPMQPAGMLPGYGQPTNANVPPVGQ